MRRSDGELYDLGGVAKPWMRLTGADECAGEKRTALIAPDAADASGAAVVERTGTLCGLNERGWTATVPPVRAGGAPLEGARDWASCALLRSALDDKGERRSRGEGVWRIDVDAP